MELDFFYWYCDNLPSTGKGCREWDSGNHQGYPFIWINGRGLRRGNRLILERKLNRKIRKKYAALHTCDNPKCVEPSHIYEGTQRNNLDDMVIRKRSPFGDNHWTRKYGGLKGSRNGMAKLNPHLIRKLRKLRSQGRTYVEIAAIVKMSKGAVRKAVLGLSWRNL